MKGWLVYNEEGAARNSWFISHLVACFYEQGIDLRLKIVTGEEENFSNLPDFALVRTIAPKLNARLERLGVITLNNGLTASVANDKYTTYETAKKLEIPVLPTWLYGAQEKEKLSYPLVLKTVDGHGGKEVSWVKSRRALPVFSDGRKRILQQPSDVLGKDMRAYVVGDEIVACVLRESNVDFRSNYTLGGKITPVEPTSAQREIVKRLYEYLKFDYVGIDFLPTANGWVLNEIEDAAGARMLYACTQVDIAEKLAVYVKEKLTNSEKDF